MTYCVGLLLDAGIVMLSDTRTNAGFDNIAIYRKMFVFEEPGDRVVTILTAGSLSITQNVIARLRHEIEPEASAETSIMLAENMLGVAEIIGRPCSRSRSRSAKLSRMDQSASASMLVGGQRRAAGCGCS